MPVLCDGQADRQEERCSQMRRTQPIALLVFGAMMLTLAFTIGQEQREVLLEHRESDLHDMYVTATRDGFRYLRFGRSTEPVGVVKLDDPGFLRLPYTRVMMSSLAFMEVEPEQVLCLGLRAGSVPMFLRHHFETAKVTVVERDKELIDLAKERLEFKAGGSVLVKPSSVRRFLTGGEQKYDLVLIDLYEGGDIPFRLSTQEFLREVKNRLQVGGYVVTRIPNTKANDTRDSVLATYQQEFSEVYLLPVPDSEEEVIVATPREGQVTRQAALRRARDLVKLSPFSFDLPTIIDRQYQYATNMRTDGRILKDAETPVQVLPVD